MRLYKPYITMNKSLLFVFATVLCASTAYAQPALNRIEFFVDTDPGFGAATLVPFSGSTVATNISVDVPMASIPAGFHRLFVRARNANSQWSVAAHYAFYKDAVSDSPDLSRIEYFVDADPGFGAATNLPFTTGPTATDVQFTLPLDNVAIGFHNLFVRSQSAEGRWSVMSRRPFYKDEVNQPDIVRLEYFVDNDPGYGAATAVAINRAVMINNLSYTVDLNGVTNGAHRLYVRAQNAQGRWSNISVRDFTVQDNVITITGAPDGWCRNTAFNVGYTATGTYNPGDVFTLQLSDATGGFINNVTALGSISSSTLTSGVFMPTIPNNVAIGSGYRLRVISSNPGVTNMPTLDFPVGTTCQCLTMSSVRPGDWSDATCWSRNRIPIGTDAVRLRHLITIPDGFLGNARTLIYDVTGRLRFNVNAWLRMNP